MWTARQRVIYRRDEERYPSNLTDMEWERLKPLIPDASPGGRPRKTDMRAAMNAIFYLLRTGCPWRYLPRDEFPARSTVYNIFRKFQKDGVWEAIWEDLHMTLRERLGREASPTAAVIDSQSLKAAEKGAVHSAGIQDRDGAALVLDKIRNRFPWLELVWADNGYNAWQVETAVAKVPVLRLEIVKRSDDLKGFVVLPRRWLVERAFSWFGRNRRIAKDDENLNRKALAFLRLASIRLMLRKLCNPA